MTEPVCAKKAPYVVELEPGDYWYCSCGRTSKQPFCDGAHKDTKFAPTKVTVTEKKKVALCGCRRAGKMPACDGAHTKL